VLDAYVLGYLALKFLYTRTVIAQPASLENVADAREKSLMIADVWASNVKGFRNVGAPPKIAKRLKSSFTAALLFSKDPELQSGKL